MWLETGLEALPYMQVGEIYVIRAYCRLPTHCWSLQQKQYIRKTNPTPTKYSSQTFAHGRKSWWLGDVLSGCQIQVVLQYLQPHEPVSYCVSKAFNLYDKAQKKVVSKLDTRTWISLLFEWSRVFPFPQLLFSLNDVSIFFPLFCEAAVVSYVSFEMLRWKFVRVDPLVHSWRLTAVYLP